MTKLTISKNEVRNNFIEYTNPNYHGTYKDTTRFLELRNLDVEHYKLCSYLSKKFKNTTILDIGTWHGTSAISFAEESTNKIISYDTFYFPEHLYIERENIELKLMDFRDDATIKWDDVSIIFIDVDPHDGKQEPPMLKFLEGTGWSGLILLDDIAYDEFPELKKMWDTLDYDKYNLTEIGHWSGTGMINFGNKYEIEIID